MAKFPPVKQPYVPLPEGETVVIKADDPKYDRGLVVKLTGKGGYDMAYWYDTPDKLYPAEIKVDGKTITKDGLIVHIGYHPELATYQSASNPRTDYEQIALYGIGGAVGGKLLFDRPIVGMIAGAILGYYQSK